MGVTTPVGSLEIGWVGGRLGWVTEAAAGEEVMLTIEVPAGTIAYTEQGWGSPVVLLHGLFMDHTVWDQVIPLLPAGFRYIRPVLPFGAHRAPMHPDADLTLPGMVALVADILDALDLADVTLVHSDWGGSLLLTAIGRDARISRMIALPCEAFDNFPPGLPGRLSVLAAQAPGGLTLAARQLRIGLIRRLPLVFGHMAKKPIDDAVVREWTTPLVDNPLVRRDVSKYLHSRIDKAQLVRQTEALRNFPGAVLVLWCTDNPVMPESSGSRLASILPNGRYLEIPGAGVLAMLDAPVAVAEQMSSFLRSSIG